MKKEKEIEEKARKKKTTEEEVSKEEEMKEKARKMTQLPISIISISSTEYPEVNDHSFV